jgi:lipopolysaccharide/colanic/teichoic acid biosynthesis glycosyltransferase
VEIAPGFLSLTMCKMEQIVFAFRGIFLDGITFTFRHENIFADTNMKILEFTSTAGMNDEVLFNTLLAMERKRSERTGTAFLFVVIKLDRIDRLRMNGSFEQLRLALGAITRETDVTGWYRYRADIGMIFTALNGTSRAVTHAAISSKIRTLLTQFLNPAEMEMTEITFRFFPDKDVSGEDGAASGNALYTDRRNARPSRKLFTVLKRVTDVVFSLAALFVLSPLFLIISVLLKMTTAGPVLYRQKRIGESGVEFTFLKFRSMYMASDSRIHQDFTKNLIRGNTGSSNGIYKIQRDPRITGFGRFLRATSLDELPQFVNVLMGQMSLVGPRPPIPYEFECYQLWHRRRIFEARPGITGSWQVNGRSRTSFDEMVRMDLQYIKTRSLWVDFKILLKTPFAMVGGRGAY